MYKFWYDYLIPKRKDKVKLCYMDTDSFIIHIQTEDFLMDFAKDVNKWFDTSAYDKNDNRPLPIEINKKVIGKFKDELNGKAMTRFCALRAKTYAFLIDDYNKEAKETRKCVIKNNLSFDHYKDTLFKNETKMASQLSFKSDCHSIYTNEINKIALNSNDDKRLQTFDRITTYPYGMNAFKVCESEMQVKIRDEPIAMYH